MNSFYTPDELRELGLKQYGEKVLISKKCSLYSAEKISIGNNVRIDDFCVLSGKIKMHDYIHIAAGVFLFAGNAGITIESFCGLSSRVVVYAVSDDYFGDALTNPTIPDEYRSVTESPVLFKKHSIVGTASVILPGVTVEEGCSIGALSLVNKSTKAWTINTGVPCKKIAPKAKTVLELEKKFLGGVSG